MVILKVKKQKSKLVAVLFFLLTFNLFAQNNNHSNHSNIIDLNKIDSILIENIVPKQESDKFGKLVIQDLSGRMMPVNTFASEILRKLRN